MLNSFPLKIVSDNGRTFNAAAKTFEDVIHHQDAQRHFDIDWCFNIEKDRGGDVRVVYQALLILKKVIG